MVDIKTGVIEFNLNTPIEISKSGGMAKVSEIKFSQPKRKHAASFENLTNLYNHAVTQSMLSMTKGIDEDLKEEAIEAAKSQKEKEKPEKITDITLELIEKEVDDMLSQLSYIEFDFDRAYKLFDKIILSQDQYCVCRVSGIPMTDNILEKIHIQDYKRMMLIYVCFFGKPVKSATGNGSGAQSDSHTQAKEL